MKKNIVDVQTTVGIAKTGTRSLKVTIPLEIVGYLELKSGDRLEWKMNTHGSKRVVEVTKVKK